MKPHRQTKWGGVRLIPECSMKPHRQIRWGGGGQIDTGMSTQTVGGGGQELVVLVWYLATPTTILKLKNDKLYSFPSGTIQSPSSHKEGTA